MTKFAKILSAIALLAGTAAVDAKVPAWLRVVDWDGQVIDLPALGVDRITACPARGSADLYAQSDGSGTAVIETAWGRMQLAYAFKFYNDGAVTNNPNTTGDQVVLIETTDAIFGANFDNCEVYQ